MDKHVCLLNNQWEIANIFFLLLWSCLTIVILIRINKMKNQLFYAVMFYTLSLPCFTQLYDDFYSSGKNVYRAERIFILYLPFKGAHWMPSGRTHSRGRIVLQTQYFYVKDVTRLINVLIIKFDCKCRIDFSEGKPRGLWKRMVYVHSYFDICRKVYTINY